MVFENLTLFEVHLDDAQIASSTTPRADRSTVSPAPEASGRRPRVLPLFVVAFVMAGVAMLWRRSQELDEEFEFEAEGTEAELAAAN